MSNLIELSAERLRKLEPDIRAALEVGPNEADTRLKVLDRVLFEVLARWTKKNDESFYGYKNHVGVDKAHKLIRKCDATDAVVHDSQKLDEVLDLSNTGKEVWASAREARRSWQRSQREPVVRCKKMDMDFEVMLLSKGTRFEPRGPEPWR
jgi:IS5 family transposase